MLQAWSVSVSVSLCLSRSLNNATESINLLMDPTSFTDNDKRREASSKTPPHDQITRRWMLNPVSLPQRAQQPLGSVNSRPPCTGCEGGIGCPLPLLDARAAGHPTQVDGGGFGLSH
ncbi:hypothetical protein B0J15DRAFT_580667 [Fusarium solani]|uniref:Uncharacterized protein n=1 Tax=Fusarium solani TaxID=169388 RepID=A0A9P9KQE8_FUSSL|nr:uncharacterized protein B0J15DRAFT_580667 [Fusarium solani]KAH7266599.1 hypothetical protein B0J15DRAFT_580667 [Fusarium solani]